jgi:glutamate-1-semialdehyde 2,1-aminomutase
VLGKPVAGGVPAAVWGLSTDVAARWTRYLDEKSPGYSGIGTTLSGNPLQFAAMRATLSEVMTETNHGHMERLAARLEAGLTEAIRRTGLPWHAARVARGWSSSARRGRSERRRGQAAHAPELEAAVHLALLNRGSLIAPFHNMMLVSPATTAQQWTASSVLRRGCGNLAA